MGIIRTYWDFYVGFGLFVSVCLLLQAAVLWQLGSIAKENAIQVRPLVGTFVLAYVGCAVLVLSVDNMKTSLSGCEPLNGAAEPRRDLLEIDVFDVTKSVRAKNRCHASRLETAGPTFIHFLKLFGPLCY